MTQSLAWAGLILSGLLDVAWALAMKQANGFARPLWTAVSLLLLAAFVFLLGKSLEVLPVGTAYAVWTGIGAAGTAIAGAWFFGESLYLQRIAGIGLVVLGIALLKLAPR